jgi:hypothetical protein
VGGKRRSASGARRKQEARSGLGEGLRGTLTLEPRVTTTAIVPPDSTPGRPNNHFLTILFLVCFLLPGWPPSFPSATQASSLYTIAFVSTWAGICRALRLAMF